MRLRTALTSGLQPAALLILLGACGDGPTAPAPRARPTRRPPPTSRSRSRSSWLTSLPRPTAGGASGEVIFGWGYGGQHVFVVPALDLVVSTNLRNRDGATRGFEIFEAVLEEVR
ncbi:MAG: hypothetical protein ABFS46_16895 [Myxococcota bacterium]